MTTTNRIEWIDRMRGLAIFSVVVQHLAYGFLCNKTWMFHKLIGISNMAVFFFISGYILTRTMRVETAKDGCNFIWKKVVQLLLPFAAWDFIAYRYFFTDHWSIITGNDLWMGIAEPHLWFLLVLFIFACILLINRLLFRGG